MQVVQEHSIHFLLAPMPALDVLHITTQNGPQVLYVYCFSGYKSWLNFVFKFI